MCVQVFPVAAHPHLLSSQITRYLMAGGLAPLQQPKPSLQMTPTQRGTGGLGCPSLTASSSETTVQSGRDLCC